METPAMRNQALQIAGRVLTFPTFTTLAVPGFDSSLLYRGMDSVYPSETQHFSFKTSSENVATLDIGRGDTFTYSDGTFTFAFTVQNIEPDLVGWCMIQAELGDYTNV